MGLAWPTAMYAFDSSTTAVAFLARNVQISVVQPGLEGPFIQWHASCRKAGCVCLSASRAEFGIRQFEFPSPIRSNVGTVCVAEAPK